MTVYINGFDVSDTADWYGWEITGKSSARGYVTEAARATFFEEIKQANISGGRHQAYTHELTQQRHTYYTRGSTWVADTATRKILVASSVPRWTYSGDDPRMSLYICCASLGRLPAVAAPALFGPDTFDTACSMGGDFLWNGAYSADSGACKGDTGANLSAFAAPIAIGSGDVRMVGTALRDSSVSERAFGYDWLNADGTPHSAGGTTIGNVGNLSGAKVAFDVTATPPVGAAFVRMWVRSPAAYGELHITQSA